ncbi:MAG: helicase associated domain-containing protein [Hydrogenophaga sp.]|uniref:helicase associated domain-containing protein n=1 Tax=Hydrogenophaga sp. TaxID=1904254 RepID=UPI00273582D4|nr:helicase associated domain-containing protein [Hydrogenophaga sp.]MDP3347668.1 helicase associated domain-containing protein [Hydrogenophaga sp.]
MHLPVKSSQLGIDAACKDMPLSTRISSTLTKAEAVSQPDLVLRVQDYFENRGHLAIARDHIEPDGFKLGHAVLRLRAFARHKTFPTHLHQQLEALGFFLGSRFWSFVASLREYIQQHGHGYVPTHYKTSSGYGLGFACAAWRMKARHPEFPAHHREHLSRAGFAFDQIAARKIKAELNPVVPKNLLAGAKQQKLIVEGLHAFKQQYGHAQVPTRYTDLQGLNLGLRLGPVHTIFPSANGLKTAPIEARDDGQTGCLA